MLGFITVEANEVVLININYRLIIYLIKIHQEGRWTDYILFALATGWARISITILPMTFHFASSSEETPVFDSSCYKLEFKI